MDEILRDTRPRFGPEFHKGRPMTPPTPEQQAKAREIAERIDASAIAYNAFGEPSFADVIEPILAAALAAAEARGAAQQAASPLVGRLKADIASLEQADTDSPLGLQFVGEDVVRLVSLLRECLTELGGVPSPHGPMTPRTSSHSSVPNDRDSGQSSSSPDFTRGRAAQEAEALLMDELSAQAWCQGIRPHIEAENADEFMSKVLDAIHSDRAQSSIRIETLERQLATAEARGRAAGLREATPEGLAQLFHDTYERLAPSFGYSTRKASAVAWADVPEPNKSLMVAVAADVLRAMATEADQ